MATYCLQGPDVAVIGWIPYFKKLSDLPAGHNYPRNLAMRLLFNSGNETPKLSFTDFSDFANWIYPLNPCGTKEYRAAVYLRDVKLHYTDEDPVPKIEFETDGFPGFTPPRIIVAGYNVSPAPIRGYHQGLGSGYDNPQAQSLPDDDGVQIKHGIQFKLGSFMDLIGRLLTGRWAPSAWIEIDYRIYKNGSLEIDFHGSAIPSHACYVDWDSVHQRDMISNTKAQISGFLSETPGCVKAPEGLYAPWKGKGQLC